MELAIIIAAVLIMLGLIRLTEVLLTIAEVLVAMINVWREMKVYYEEVPDNYIGDYPSVTIYYRKSESAEAETIALYLGDTQNPFTKERRKMEREK